MNLPGCLRENSAIVSLFIHLGEPRVHVLKLITQPIPRLVYVGTDIPRKAPPLIIGVSWISIVTCYQVNVLCGLNVGFKIDDSRHCVLSLSLLLAVVFPEESGHYLSLTGSLWPVT